jgi:chromosome segregation ATPase
MTETVNGSGAGPWGEWSRHVLLALEKNQTALDTLRAEHSAMEVQLALANQKLDELKANLAATEAKHETLRGQVEQARSSIAVMEAKAAVLGGVAGLLLGLLVKFL